MDERWLIRQFGVRLSERRSDAKISQEELARRAGVSRTSIVNIEKGRQGVSIGTLYRLADALQVDPAELLPERPPADRVAITLGGDTDDAQRAVQAVLRSATKR